MISVGIDVSKEKFTVCALEQGSKIIWKPIDVYLNKKEVEELIEKLEKLKEEIKRRNKNNNGSNRKISSTDTL